MKRILSLLLMVLLFISNPMKFGIAENTDSLKDSTFSVFSGITWGDDIEYVKSVTGCTKSRTIDGVVTYLEFETPFATEIATVDMYFVEDRLSKILFLFILPHDGFDEELLSEIENEFEQYTLTEKEAKQWLLEDGTTIEMTSDKNAVTLTFDYAVELLN